MRAHYGWGTGKTDFFTGALFGVFSVEGKLKENRNDANDARNTVDENDGKKKKNENVIGKTAAIRRGVGRILEKKIK